MRGNTRHCNIPGSILDEAEKQVSPGESTNMMIVAMWVGGIAMLVWIVMEYAIDGWRTWREKRRLRDQTVHETSESAVANVDEGIGHFDRTGGEPLTGRQ